MRCDPCFECHYSVEGFAHTSDAYLIILYCLQAQLLMIKKITHGRVVQWAPRSVLDQGAHLEGALRTHPRDGAVA